MDRPPSPTAERFAALPELLTIEQIAAMLNVSTKTIRRWVGRGAFPEPARFSCRLHRWPKTTVCDWLHTKQGEAQP